VFIWEIFGFFVGLYLEYHDPYGPSSFSEGTTPPIQEKKAGFFEKIFGDTALRHPVEQRIENRRAGHTRQRRPFVSWILSAVMIGVLIYELIYNQKEQHSPISFKVCHRALDSPMHIRMESLFSAMMP
jgi:hypothetical protein